MDEDEKSDKASGSSDSGLPHSDSVSVGEDLVYGDELLTPRLAAELEIKRSVRIAGRSIRSILALRAFASMADAIGSKTQASLAQWVLESANNIGAANGGKAPMQLPAAAAQSGALQMMLAQRMAAKRNAQHVVQRRIVEVVQPVAAEADGGMQPMAAEPNAADGVDSNGETS